MRRYEIILIMDPDLSDKDRDSLLEKFKETIQQHEGTFLKIEDWGQRRLAYEIKKKSRGYYTLIDLCGAGPLVNALEHLFRIDDKVLKFMTVLLDKEVNVEEAKEEIAREEAEKEKALKEKSEAEQETEPSAPASEAPSEQPEKNPPEEKPLSNKDSSEPSEENTAPSSVEAEDTAGKEQ